MRFIMWSWKVCYMMFILLLLIRQSCSMEFYRLNYSLLNYQENISVSLENYFVNPAGVKIDDQNSTMGIRDILNVNFTGRPVSEVSSMLLSANMSDGSTADFNTYTMVMEKSVFNHPNKIFLMTGNMIFSVRYQVSSSDTFSYVEAFKITGDSSNCTQIEVKQFNSSYYLFVGCLFSNANATVYLYKFVETISGFLSELIYTDKFEVKMAVSCSRISLYGFDQLVYSRRLFTNQVLFFCTTWVNPLFQPNKTYVLKVVTNSKGTDILSQQSYSDGALFNCTRNSTMMLNYQKGFLSLVGPYLRYYSYDASSLVGYCASTFLNVNGLKFVISVKENGIQYVYAIFQDSIIIKESYSPNYELFNIDLQLIKGLSLTDYSIARRFLALLYENSTDYYLLTFDLHSSYPKLVDVLHYPRTYTFLHLFSVQNYLEIGNYFIVSDAIENLFNLSIYMGYEAAISIKNSSLALGEIVLALTDSQSAELQMNFNIRDFNDLTLQKSKNADHILLLEDVLNINLTNYVIGPLGRFYNYPSNLSVFQYVNYESQISVEKQLGAVKDVLTAFSINNELSQPIITFYFRGSNILTCEVNFTIYNHQTQLIQCKQGKIRKHAIDTPLKILVLLQQRYIQYDNRSIELCQLSSNGDFECSALNILAFSDILGVKVVTYSHTDKDEYMELIVFGKKKIAYIYLSRLYPRKIYDVGINYLIQQNNIPDLAQMSVVDVSFDQGYKNFLVLQLLADADNRQKLIIYDKPFILANSTSTLIGHIIEAFDFGKITLEAYFCINNLLVLVTTNMVGSSIQEYKINKEFRLRFSRSYPIYGFKIKMGGRHTQNQNFIFLQIEDNDQPYYLVYSPLLPSSNLLTHKISLADGEPIFSQQVDPIANSSLFILGSKRMIGVTHPNFVLKLMRNSSLSMTLSSFNISVVDSFQSLSILNFPFSYNQNQGQISYLQQGDININLNYTVINDTFVIESKNLLGIVGDYNISLPDKEECNFIKIDRQDIFTKQQCLLYYKSLEYGTITDFMAISVNGVEIEIIVTDICLFCVRNRLLTGLVNQNFANLTDCRFVTDQTSVVMTCMNSNILSRQIFNITVNYGLSSCRVSFVPIPIPGNFVYQDFDVQFSQNFIIFEVPIRLEDNKIYYKTRFQNGVIDSNYSLLRREKQKDVFQTEFPSIDTSFMGELFIILEDGIGIYNISDTDQALSPALWISYKQLAVIAHEQPLAYVKILQLNQQEEAHILLVELGTDWASLQVEITFKISANSTIGQTIYDLISLKPVFEYEQYVNCRNSGHSESQRFENLVVKICDYQPNVYSVFANFIAMNNDSSNTLIQFYNRSGDSSYSVRIEIIYSNTLSYHDFFIRGSTLVVGSLFNMLCYYELTPILSWSITHYHDSTLDQNCEGNLVIYNKQFALNKRFNVNYDGDSEYQYYWSIDSLYIQRGILGLMLLNTIRLLIMRRRQAKFRVQKKNSNRLHSSRFEVMVKINSKKQI